MRCGLIEERLNFCFKYLERKGGIIKVYYVYANELDELLINIERNKVYRAQALSVNTKNI